MGSRHLTLALLLAPCAPASIAADLPPRVLNTRFSYTATVPTAPKGSKTLRLWVPVPSDNPQQTISNLKIDCPVPHRITQEAEHGNRMVFVETDAAKRPSMLLAPTCRQ